MLIKIPFLQIFHTKTQFKPTINNPINLFPTKYQYLKTEKEQVPTNLPPLHAKVNKETTMTPNNQI